MLKYKPGQKVLITREMPTLMVEEMVEDYGGTIMTIKDTIYNNTRYRMHEDEQDWVWDDTCIVRLAGNIRRRREAP